MSTTHSPEALEKIKQDKEREERRKEREYYLRIGGNTSGTID